MRTKILAFLQEKAEEKYRDFSAKLLPPQTELLGVRIPTLRQYAKTLLKEGQGETYLKLSLSKLQYQEELMLYALILANAKMLPDDKIPLIQKFIPYINSWAVCDIFCADLKEVKKHPKLFYDTFQLACNTEQEYQVRFFYVLALNYFITSGYMNKVFAHIAKQKYTGYYDKMAVAWLLSVAYVKFPEETESFLFNTSLDTFVFKKSISKICESFRVTKEAKIRLRTLASVHKA